MLHSLIGPVEIDYGLDLLLAMALGFALGAERELRGKDAGISTHTLVIVGAMQGDGLRREGWRQARPSPGPSFETHRLRDAPQDEGRRGCRYDSNFKIAELVE